MKSSNFTTFNFHQLFGQKIWMLGTGARWSPPWTLEMNPVAKVYMAPEVCMLDVAVLAP